MTKPETLSDFTDAFMLCVAGDGDPYIKVQFRDLERAQYGDLEAKLEVAERALAERTAGPVAGNEINLMADAIDAARYAHPQHPRERPRPFADADKGDREYVFRLARAAFKAIPALSLSPAPRDVEPVSFEPRRRGYDEKYLASLRTAGFHAAAQELERMMLTATPPLPIGNEGLVEALHREWTNFCDANPDDLTLPEDTPDHALMTCEQFVAYALAAQPQEAGMVLVPREPTEAMRKAGAEWTNYDGIENPDMTDVDCFVAQRVYGAMLAAAPNKGEAS